MHLQEHKSQPRLKGVRLVFPITVLVFAVLGFTFLVQFTPSLRSWQWIGGVVFAFVMLSVALLSLLSFRRGGRKR